MIISFKNYQKFGNSSLIINIDTFIHIILLSNNIHFKIFVQQRPFAIKPNILLNTTKNMDDVSESHVIIGFGALSMKDCSPSFITDNARIETSKSTQTINPSPLKPILVDLNNLQSDEDCPHGCKVDVYVTVRHRPGCKHDIKSEFNIGMKKFDYIGKGTYLYQTESEEGCGLMSHSEYKRRCQEFSERCENILKRISNPILDIKQTCSQMMLKQSDHNISVSNEGDILISTFTKSEIDLYE